MSPKMSMYSQYFLSSIYDPLPVISILTSVDSDEPVQPPFKLRHSKCCLVSSLTIIKYSSN